MSFWLAPSSFWNPDYVCESAWHAHGPFAFWLIDALRPRTLVELGTHWGYSYFCFCQAIARLGYASKCFAIDTWEGDEQAGFYDEDVFESVQRHNANHYASFSSLVRTPFAEAVQYFADGSIDLLHIDGAHYYEDVKTDFETWLPKLSDRSVVLFHDTNVRERKFGVCQLWDELRGQYPNFEFVHGHGLGVLATGSVLPEAVRTFLQIGQTETFRVSIRDAYSRLGAHIVADADAARAAAEIATIEAQRDALLRNNEEHSKTIDNLTMELQLLRANKNDAVVQRDAMRRIVRRQAAIIDDLRRSMVNQTLQRQLAAVPASQLARLARSLPAPMKTFLKRVVLRRPDGTS